MAYCQNDDLGRIANEGFQDIEGQLGRTIRCNPLQYHQQLGPQHVTVLWKPGFRNTSVTYFNDRVPPQKEACNPRSNLLQATQGRGGPNSYDHGGNGYVITSDEAAKKYGVTRKLKTMVVT
ncbi:hypothetical protein SLA2020_508390 [Shorea laevis]